MAIVEAASTNVLLEREPSLAQLQAALAGAAAGHGRLVFVGGEAGAGKTALVRRFCEELPRAPTVLWGSCDALSTPRPLGPFVDIAASLAGTLGEVVGSGSGAHDIAASLFAVADDRAPVVLVLEDVHWADEATLDVVRVLGRRVGDSSVLAVATYRDDELDRAHPLRIVLGELATAHDVERLRSERLSLEAVARLAEGRATDVGRLWQLTSGNPFYVTELLASGSDVIPETVRDAVLARVARLGPAALSVVEAASVAPPSLDAALVLAVCGEAADSVDECLAAGVLVAANGGVAFPHELSRVAVEDFLSPTRRLALHRAVLLALMDTAGADADLARIAHHADAAQDAASVLEHAPRAARQAAAAGAYRESAAQYARALRYAGGLAPGARAELLEGRSRACYLADDQREAIEVVREAIACRQAEGSPLGEARALTELAGYLSCRGFLREGEETVRRASGLVRGVPESREHAYVLHEEACWRIGGGDVDAGLVLAHRAIAIGERFDDPHVVGDARVTVGSAIARQDFGRGHRLLRDAVEDARRRGNTEVASRGLNAVAVRSLTANRHDLAGPYIDEAVAYCTEHSEDLWRINILAIGARWSLERGRWDETAQHVRGVLEDPRESPWPHHEVLCVLAVLRARRGDPGAREALAEADAVGVPPDEVGAHVDLAAARAEVAWTERAPEQVDATTAEALAAAVDRADADAVCRLSFWRALAGLEVDVPASSTEAHALALAGEWRAAAEAWTDTQRPYEAAVALSRAGDVDALREALAELQRLGAGPLAAIVARELRERGARDVPRGPRKGTRENPAGLTRREVEVVRLVAEGLRNAEIAERLVLSRRTVDHHVSAILRKLDAGSRGEAVAAAQRLGLLAEE